MKRAAGRGHLCARSKILENHYCAFRGYVFALLFYKRISDVYIEEIKKLTERLGDEELARDPRINDFVVPDDALEDFSELLAKH